MILVALALCLWGSDKLLLGYGIVTLVCGVVDYLIDYSEDT